jgi:predicted amidohydrolase YtcJ
MPVAAAVVGDAAVAAVLTALDVAAEGGGAAGLDRRHHLELMEAQVPSMGGPVGGPGSTEDVGDLE